jgi:cytochrome c-type biogenesis protein CcmH
LLLRTSFKRAAAAGGAEIETLRRQLAQLDELARTGALAGDALAQSKAQLERQLIDAVVRQPAAAPRRDLSLALALGLGVFMLAVAVGGYWWLGSPAGVGVTPVVSTDSGAADPHAMGFGDIAALADKLAGRLEQQPDDAEGWAMLARSYSVLGRHADAAGAFKRAAALRTDDADLLADYADALAMANNRSLEGEPLRLVQRALKLDPNNLKALSLAGTAAFDRRDYASAIEFWQRVSAVGPSDNEFVQQVQDSIAEARASLAGAPAAAKPSAGAAPAQSAAVASVSGTVSLAPALAKQASPGDTVFIFARPADGSRMPLAIQRKQVKDLPLKFTLDDSMAMAPERKLSSAARVVIGARISKSGDAMPRPGDLQGASAPVAPGASGVKIEINEAVK